ncbi:MAG TPA: sigma-54-dependent Fis family transcriptional regulator, partial [bacterium]|nr:sigma-54-dependent Fis family transcriptional regulator [bacterium]
LILVDEHGEREYFVSKNFDGQNIDDPAAEVSTSVIQKTLDALQPIKVDDDTLSESIMKQGSFVRLGLRAVMSVPIIFRKKLLGVVYLDRREETKGFLDNDLAFLMAFSRQIAFRVNELKEQQHVHTEYERRDRNRLQSLREKYNFSEIIGKSERLVKVLELAGKVASSEVTVLIQGESGTGKELIARAIHFNSDRYEHKFIAINCGAIPSELLESELFGYESGAFTGAVKTKIGKFEAAHRGTLFLDEVAELSMNLQAKILRVLQTKELERLGSTETRKIDLRIISASNKNLQQMVREGKFREDLYYRLKVVEIELPALRERKEDIHLLVSFFVQKYGEQRIQSVSEDAMDILENYAWHGNIRELENVIQRAIILSSGTQIEVQDLPPEIVSKTESGYKVDKDLSLEEAETDFRRWFVLRALRKNNNNKSKAAEMLGINRTHFFRMLNQLGISDTE